MTSVKLNDRKIAIESAMRRLVSAEHFASDSLVTMPCLYPSGTSVVLQINGGNGRFSISDRGGAYSEAEFMGILPLFKREAERTIFEEAVSFNGRELGLAGIELENMPVALTVLASVSQRIAVQTSSKAAEKQKQKDGYALYERLIKIFSPTKVARDFEIQGASSHNWHFDAVVQNQRSKIVFDAVNSHQQSVVWAAAKFGDLSRLETAMKKVAVIDNRETMGNMIGVLQPNVNAIIEMSSPDTTFERLEAA